MKKTSRTRVLGYVRVSTEGQEENFSTQIQTRSIKDFCRSRGWDLVEIYSDVSSGGNLDRPGFQSMREHLETNGFDGVVVYKIDRLSRSIVDGKVFTDTLLSKDKFLLSITESIDTSTPNGRMFFNLLMVFSENEREVIKERMMSGRNELLRQKKFPASYLFGYERDEEGDLIVVPEESKIIEEMFDTYLELESIGGVERVFKDRGYKTRQGKNFTRQTLQNLLRHESMKGEGFRWKGEIVRGDVPRIVSTQKWNKVQKILDSRSRKKS